MQEPLTFAGGWSGPPVDVHAPDFSLIESKLAALAYADADAGEDYEIDDSKVAIYDQLTQGSCIVNAGCAMERILWCMAHPDEPVAPELSRQFGYWVLRVVDGKTGEDKGGYVHSFFTALMRFGVCLEKLWPYLEERKFEEPDLEAFQQAVDNRISAFYSITSTGTQRLDDIETAIRANHPPMFGTGVGQEWMDFRGGDVAFGPPETSKGGHSMLWTGIRRRAGRRQFKTRNSWSRRWGNSGSGWMDESWVLSPSTGDIQVGTKMPELIL